MTDSATNTLPSLRELFVQVWGVLTPRHRTRAVFVMSLILVGTALEILGVGLIIPVVALLNQPNFDATWPTMKSLHVFLGSPLPQTFMLWVLGGLLGVFLVKNTFLLVSTYCQVRFLSDIQAGLSGELVSGYLHRSYAYHTQHPTADLLQKINGELPSLINGVLSPLLWIVSESLVVLGILLLSLWVNPLGTLVAMGGLGLAMWAYYHAFKSRVEHWGRQTQQDAQGMYQQMQHGFGGIKEVKIFGRENFFSAAFARYATGFARNVGRHNFLAQSSRHLIELLVITVLLGAVMVLVARGNGMSDIVPTLAFFAAAAFRLMPSAQRLLANLHSIRYGARSLHLLRPDLLHARNHSTVKPIRSAPVKFQDTLEFRHVTFCYPGGHEDVLRDVNLSIRRGTMVGFQGQSGAGKTTLVDLLMGLLEPTRGDILVDGASIHDSLPGWQAHIGYVPQSIFLIDDTLRRNVAFGIEGSDIDDTRVVAALRQAQLWDFVAARPEGMETQVGERGVRLSGGQRQRIGIARALYRNPVVLVLDEATASLDLDTEAEFIKGVETLKTNKTVIIISHRPSAMAGCDAHYSLSNGKVQILDGMAGARSK